MPEDGKQVLVWWRSPTLHVGAHGGAKDAHGRKRPEAGDVIDGPQSVLQRLHSGDDFPRAGSLAQEPGGVFEGAEEGLLADQFGFSRAEASEIVGVVELVAEAEMIGPEFDQPVVLPQVSGGHELEPHQRPDSRLHSLHVGRGAVKVLVGLVARIEVYEGNVRLFLGGPRHLDHVLDVFEGHFVHAYVQPGGAELAVERRRVMPEAAGIRDIDAEVGALQDPILLMGTPRVVWRWYHAGSGGNRTG